VKRSVNARGFESNYSRVERSSTAAFNKVLYSRICNRSILSTNATTKATTTSSSSNSQQSQIEQLNTKMAQISSSNKPEDIATLAYIWGFPLITMQRQFNFVTSPNVPPGVGRGPANALSCARELINASFTDVVSPNYDTLYCITQFDLKKNQ
jgi:hypothetical protein